MGRRGRYQGPISPFNFPHPPGWLRASQLPSPTVLEAKKQTQILQPRSGYLTSYQRCPPLTCYLTHTHNYSPLRGFPLPSGLSLGLPMRSLAHPDQLSFDHLPMNAHTVVYPQPSLCRGLPYPLSIPYKLPLGRALKTGPEVRKPTPLPC